MYLFLEGNVNLQCKCLHKQLASANQYLTVNQCSCDVVQMIELVIVNRIKNIFCFPFSAYQCCLTKNGQMLWSYRLLQTKNDIQFCNAHPSFWWIILSICCLSGWLIALKIRDAFLVNRVSITSSFSCWTLNMMVLVLLLKNELKFSPVLLQLDRFVVKIKWCISSFMILIMKFKTN